MKKTLFFALALFSMATTNAQLKSGLTPENMDRSASPTENFDQFANGGWKKNNPVPAAYSRYTMFDILRDNNDKKNTELMNELLTKTYAKGTNEQKISDFYKLAMDSVRRNKEGITPVKPLIQEIEESKTIGELKAFWERHPFMRVGSLYGGGFGVDAKNSEWNIFHASGAGLSLGQKEYYTEKTKEAKEIREKFKEHIERMFKVYGIKNAKKKAQLVYDLEMKIAEVSLTTTERRDVERMYNKMTLAKFKEKWPNIDIVSNVKRMYKLPDDCFEDVIVGNLRYFDWVNTFEPGMSADMLKAYMEWDLIQNTCNRLSDECAEANFEFFGKVLEGKKEMKPRWQRCLSQVEGAFGQQIGKAYVEKYFPESSKKRMEELVANLQKALAIRIIEQDWMTSETKYAAIQKLSTFRVKIGYPDKWDDISEITIDPAKSYIENTQAVNEFKTIDHLRKTAGKKVDRTRWGMYPQTVNAYYNPTTNEICFPAGILQPPYFNAEADDAANYGAIGVVIGHEMTHGFDDKGSLFDMNGNMLKWWKQEDREAFQKKADFFAEYFNDVEILPGLKCNGKMTNGENLADHGGLSVALEAFKLATAQKPLEDKDGFTPTQRFFLSYASVWAGNWTEQGLKYLQKNDVHSIGFIRVNEALKHIDAFYEAFNVKEGDKMYIAPEKRLKLW
ncbi:MAG: M13 family metallopeptidase [Bacteroidaceae bacterium]|nr:M13 family metallopeptidase [Bacteroidaceae bacterium]